MAGAFSGKTKANNSIYAGSGPWLMMPSWLMIGFLLTNPCRDNVRLSFLTKEFRGGVIWEFSLAAYDQFFVYRGLFGDEPPPLNGLILGYSGAQSGRQG